MYTNAKQSIPERFVEKMDVDRRLAAVKRSKIINYREAKHLKERQDGLRHSCKMFIIDQQTNGSPDKVD